MHTTVARAPNKGANIDCLDFSLKLRQIPPLIADLEECRPSFSPDLRAEVFADLKILAGAIEGADQEWPELERPSLRALDAIYWLMARLTIAVTGHHRHSKGGDTMSQWTSPDNPLAAKHVLNRLAECDDRPLLARVTFGETATQRALVGRIGEVLRCDGDIVLLLGAVSASADRAVISAANYQLFEPVRL